MRQGSDTRKDKSAGERMKRRIDQLLNEKFEYTMPVMRLSPESVRISVRKGESGRGSFTIENPAQKKMKGFLYSTNPRVGLEPATFSGIQEKIIYEADTTGMEEGEVLEGEFAICSNIGQYRLPYRFEIERTLVRTSREIIESLEKFTALAKKDFQKAYSLFSGGDFAAMLERDAPQYMTLYEGLTAQAPSYRSLEEFLDGAEQKEPIHITADRQEASYDRLVQPIQEQVVLTKNTWGYLRLEVSADAPFIWIEKPIITNDDFIGSTYTLNYLIDPSRMHAGNNYGRISIEGVNTLLTLDITAKAAPKGVRDRRLLEQNRQIAKLEELYISFRTRKIDLSAWSGESLDAMAKYEAAGGTRTMMRLVKAQLLFAADREDEACMLLENIEQHRECLNTPQLEGYYLYLTTFYHKEKEYVDYVEAKVGGMLLKDSANWVLQWVLLYIQEKLLRHPAEKLSAIRRQFQYGCRSRIMYLEAALVLEKSPLLLKRLDEFEIHTLSFMCREKLVGAELVMQIAELAGRARNYQRLLYGILQEAYEVYPSKGLLMAICSLLIKGHKTGPSCFLWFQRGVEQDIRLTGLYEYYIESMPSRSREPLPQIIRMYFSYNNTLNHEKKAAVYANVIRNRKTDAHTYNSYRPAMERFMLEQLQAGRISRNLALLYRTFLNKSLINRKNADNLVKALFTYEIRCGNNKIRSVAVQHRELAGEQRVSLKNGRAYVQLYTKDYQIFLCDEGGARYVSTIPYKKERLMEDAELLEICRETAPLSPGLVLFDCSENGGRLNEKNVRLFQRMLKIPGVKESCREQLRQEILDYCYERRETEEAAVWLTKEDLDDFAKTDKKKLAELLISQGMYQEAFSVVSVYGPEKISPAALVRLCSRMILRFESREDDMLLALCAVCLDQEKYDETILTYLLTYYDGPVEKMKRLWDAGDTFGLDTYRLEEKILLMILFTRQGMDNTEKIFDSYRRSVGKKMLLKAYAILMSYEYFVREKPVGDPVFAYLERGFEKGKNQEQVCRLALLRRYAEKETLTSEEKENVNQLLEQYSNENVAFAFFKRFDPGLLRAFLLFDKSFVEYRTNPAATVTITYHFEYEGKEPSREHRETLNALFEGIFVKQVVLFRGEKLVYSIKEEFGGNISETKTQELIFEEEDANTMAGSYGSINRLIAKMGEEEAARAEILDYREKKTLAEEVFVLQ